MTDFKMQSMNNVDENIQKIGSLFPNCLTETKNDEGKVVRAIDFDMLKQELLNGIVEGNDERYQFTWPDKKKSILLANSPIKKTLRPCKEESLDFENTENLYIEGDNLDVLKLLQETYLGKVKMIYIDPPYNTGKDFVYEDNFTQNTEEYLENSGQFDEDGNRLVQNTESNGRFHTDWLNMIYPRLKIARNLLREDGIVFISLDDNELDNILKIVYEIFGEHNVLGCFPRVTKKAGKSTDAIAKNNDYVIMCTKGQEYEIILPSHTDEGFKFSDEYVDVRGKYKLNQTLDYDSLQYSPSLDYPIEINGSTVYPGQSYEKYLERKAGRYARADWAWRWSKELFEFGLKNGFIVLKEYDTYSRIYTKTYQNAKIVRKGKNFEIEYIRRTKPVSSLEFVDNNYSNDNSKKNLLEVFETSVFDYSKPVSLIKKLAEISTEKDDIILDFFSGSATTASAIMELNKETKGKRKFIMVQLPEQTDEKSEAYKSGYKNICEVGKERIRRTGRKIKEENEILSNNFDTGFRVLKLDSTNMKDVYYSPNEYQIGFLEDTIDNVKEDRTSEDLLFQVMLELGVLLSSKIEEEIINDKKVFNVDGGFLIACFDENVTEETIEFIAKKKPYYFVMRDSSLASDSVATNFEQIFANYSPDTIRKVL